MLGFDLVGLRVVPGEGEAAGAARQGRDAARLAWWSGSRPSTSRERAYYTTKDPDGKPMEPPTKVLDAQNGVPVAPDPAAGRRGRRTIRPIDAIVAGWSATRLPRRRDDRLPIDWTLEGLLAAMGALELSVPANALPPKKPGRLLGSLAGTGRVRHRRRDREPDRRHRIRVRRGRGPRPRPSRPSRSVTARLIAGARAKRKARTIGNALGLTTLTGSATPRADRPARSEDSGDPAPAGTGATGRAAHTAIEVPYRPDPVAEPLRRLVPRGPARPRPRESGHTELWHPRLGVRREDGTLIDGDDPLRTLRAVWTLDDHHCYVEQTARYTPARQLPLADVARRLRPPQRRAPLVELRAGAMATTKDTLVRAEPARRRKLLALVITRRVAGLAWPRGRSGSRPALSVEEWRHRATLGHDHYVLVVYEGFLSPFGHRASVIKITERQFHGEQAGRHFVPPPAHVPRRTASR